MNKSYTVPNISCGHCTATIERELKMVEGVEAVKADQESKVVAVDVKEPSVLATVEATLEEIGYPAQK
jgi:copper chaperone